MRLKWKNKLRSGALQFTIFISVIIALLLAGLVLLVYTHRFFLEQSKAIVENIQSTDTGIEFLKKQDIYTIDTLFIPLPDALEGQSIKVHSSQWGAFEKAYVAATNKNKRFIKCSLLGSCLKNSKRPALYLQETSKPLMVVANTKIEGTAYLPKQGVRPGHISGKSFYGTELVNGNIQQSDDKLPALKPDCKKNIQYYLDSYEPSTAGDYIELKSNNRITNSFKEPTKGFYSKQAIIIDKMSLYGNIIIRSDVKITVKNTSDLKDIILTAPVIEIENGVNGNFQAIANTTIKIGQNCILNYPSAFVLLEKEGMEKPKGYDPFHNKIYIDKNTVVKGSISYLKTSNETGYMPNVYIAPKSNIKGEIYSEGNLELWGKVTGSVYTYQFITNEGGTVYINHLYDAVITREGLPEAFGGMLFETESKSVMKWLY